MKDTQAKPTVPFPAPESLQSKLERDLKAWQAAKALIARARTAR
jgi:hypothetical protein